MCMFKLNANVHVYVHIVHTVLVNNDIDTETQLQIYIKLIKRLRDAEGVWRIQVQIGSFHPKLLISRS